MYPRGEKNDGFFKENSNRSIFCFINIGSKKIKAIFSIESPSWNHHQGFRMYNSCDKVYIMFESEECMVIDYHFIDVLDVQYRNLTAREINEYDKTLMKDLFNTVDDIYDSHFFNKIIRTETCSLDYDFITKITLRPVTREYSKWLDNDIHFVSPTDETFDEICFTMANGKSFIICADDAEVDGYVLIWSEDTNEIITDR